MPDTKKVLSTGRFGARYGVGIRKRILKIELKQKQKYLCPHCSSGRLKRIDRGIFLCKKCKKKFSGGTYIPQTLTGGIIKKMVGQKNFIVFEKELLEAKGRSVKEEALEHEKAGPKSKEDEKKK